jgi:hypothetical protein
MAKQRSSREAGGEAIENKAKEEAIENKAGEKAVGKRAKKRAKKKAIKKKAREEAIENKAEEEAIEDKAEEEVIEKKAKEKAIKKKPKEEAIENLDSSSIVNPVTKKRTASTHEPSDRPQKARKRTASARVDKEAQIAAEARGVTRKNIPWDTFRSTYLCDFNVEAQSKLAVESVKEIGDGEWKEKLVWKRLRKVLSAKVRCSGCAFISLSVLC